MEIGGRNSEIGSQSTQVRTKWSASSRLSTLNPPLSLFQPRTADDGPLTTHPMFLSPIVLPLLFASLASFCGHNGPALP